ncbi:hypothetical protein CJF30_00002409 [Rutstroemia sp. NJR-2017a BBW]|nr:hypothetical protein CJF30_00002409 [Rutstroemia sp. NJR-2017a BBW]
MAYSGGIQFMDISLQEVDWIDNLRFDEERESTLIADVGKFRNCTLKPDGDHYVVLNFSRMESGWVRYDVEDSEELWKPQCVVVGRTEKSGIVKHIGSSIRCLE